MNDSIGKQPHRIRLHGPWDLAIVSEEAPVPLPRQSMPSVLNGGGEAGSVTYLLERRFGKPTGLDEKSRVCLIVEKPADGLEVEVNGKRLPLAVSQFDITALLEHSNRLSMRLTIGKIGWLPFAGCRLEIAEKADSADQVF